MKAINIILDETIPMFSKFVEIEDDLGRSISIGQRIYTNDGLTRIRITHEDIENAEND